MDIGSTSGCKSPHSESTIDTTLSDPTTPRLCREAERAMQRYEEWMQLREIGIRKCEEKNLPLPTYLREPPPPPPEPFHDEDVGDVSAEMIQHETAEGSESFNLERSLADDQVPVADPEVEGLHRSPIVSQRMSCI
jgi:hypothetical protein